MQLPADQAVVMISGHAPIRARKLRYYEDRNFTLRLRPAPKLSDSGFQDRPPARADTWTAGFNAKAAYEKPALFSQVESGTADEGGLQRKPELLLSTLDDVECKSPNATEDERRELRPPLPSDVSRGPKLSRAARLAALDPYDDIPL